MDRSFVQRIETNRIERKVVQNMTDLAPIFGAKVCVEGVETAGMVELLRNFHVGSFQGYYYARPLPIDDILEWGK